MSKQTNTNVVENNAATKTASKRPTRKQFGIARKLAGETGSAIPAAAIYNRRAMSRFIAANLSAAAA